MEIILAPGPGLIIFPWPDINNGGHPPTHSPLVLAPLKVEAGGGVGGEAGGQCVSPEAAKDSDQGGAGGDAKEKGEPGPEVARIARQTGPGCEIINIPRDRRESVECKVGKEGKTISTEGK